MIVIVGNRKLHKCVLESLSFIAEPFPRAGGACPKTCRTILVGLLVAQPQLRPQQFVNIFNTLQDDLGELFS